MPTGKSSKTMNAHANDKHEDDPFRSVSYGVFGRNGAYDEVPSWDIVPHPCYGKDNKMPHGGKNEEYCK